MSDTVLGADIRNSTKHIKPLLSLVEAYKIYNFLSGKKTLQESVSG